MLPTCGEGPTWCGVLERAEIPHRQIGQCRHSFAILALKQHKPLNWIQRQMGHRTLQMLLKQVGMI